MLPSDIGQTRENLLDGLTGEDHYGVSWLVVGKSGDQWPSPALSSDQLLPNRAFAKPDTGMSLATLVVDSILGTGLNGPARSDEMLNRGGA